MKKFMIFGVLLAHSSLVFAANPNKKPDLEQRITDIETVNANQQIEIDANTAKNSEQDGRFSAIETKNTNQDAAINGLTTRVDALEAGSGDLDLIPGGNYVKQDLSGMDLSGLDLTGANFMYADLTNVDFTGSDISSINFYRSIADGADFSSAILDITNTSIGFPTNFFGVSLKGANFSGLSLLMSFFQLTDLTNANFSNTVLFGSISPPNNERAIKSFDFVNFLGADFSQLSSTSVQYIEGIGMTCPDGYVTITNDGNCIGHY